MFDIVQIAGHDDFHAKGEPSKKCFAQYLQLFQEPIVLSVPGTDIRLQITDWAYQ